MILNHPTRPASLVEIDYTGPEAASIRAAAEERGETVWEFLRAATQDYLHERSLVIHPIHMPPLAVAALIPTAALLSVVLPVLPAALASTPS